MERQWYVTLADLMAHHGTLAMVLVLRHRRSEGSAPLSGGRPRFSQLFGALGEHCHRSQLDDYFLWDSWVKTGGRRVRLRRTPGARQTPTSWVCLSA